MVDICLTFYSIAHEDSETIWHLTQFTLIAELCTESNSFFTVFSQVLQMQLIKSNIYDQLNLTLTQGGSGGPMTCQHKGRNTLAGVSSWGTKRNNPCDVCKPKIYSRISTFKHFIVDNFENIGKERCSLYCFCQKFLSWRSRIALDENTQRMWILWQIKHLFFSFFYNYSYKNFVQFEHAMNKMRVKTDLNCGLIRYYWYYLLIVCC